MSFESLGLSAELLRALSEEGYTHPTAIQKEAIPVVLAGRDVLAAAQTGTGKTAGFTLPLLQRLSAPGESKNKPNQPRALILTPTRELAAQVAESVTTYGRHLNQSSSVIFGGVKISPQIAALRRGVDILIATPGRLLDHVQQRTLDLSKIEILVLDEADRMLDMGFIHDIRKVLALLPSKRQTLLFSATFSNEIRALADKLLDRPVSVEVSPRNTAVESVAQVVHPVDKARKRELLSFLIGSNNWRQVLVFTRTKHGANPARYGCWWPPTSPHAAWTSISCPMWSTSSCRTCRKTMSTASAAPAVQATRVRPCRWSASTSTSCCAISSICSGAGSIAIPCPRAQAAARYRASARAQDP
jgi:ATP-dependent RNA helicase RhlE